MRIVVASHNDGKIAEISSILSGSGIELAGLGEFAAYTEPEENGETFLDNAMIKAVAAHEATGLPALADDSGIVVDALGGLPGVRSARYGGEGLTDGERCAKLLGELGGVPDGERTARFICVMVLYPAPGTSPVAGGEALFTEGILEGRITREPVGENGFGYDPVFYVPEAGKTVAEMELAGKNRISHRYRALIEMKALLDRGGETLE
jgi:XTP/dITP diphosphohydrolase